MKDLKNNLPRHLDESEMVAVIQAAAILEKAFKKKCYIASVNPDINNKDDVHGVAFSFDKWEIWTGERKKTM